MVEFLSKKKPSAISAETADLREGNKLSLTVDHK
jgi:hypothetical protein